MLTLTLLKDCRQVDLHSVDGLTLRLVDAHCPSQDQRYLYNRIRVPILRSSSQKFTCSRDASTSPRPLTTSNLVGVKRRVWPLWWKRTTGHFGQCGRSTAAGLFGCSFEIESSTQRKHCFRACCIVTKSLTMPRDPLTRVRSVLVRFCRMLVNVSEAIQMQTVHTTMSITCAPILRGNSLTANVWSAIRVARSPSIIFPVMSTPGTSYA